MIVIYDSPGFNLRKFLESLSFNLISRLVGMVVRLALMAAGLFVLFLLVTLGFIFLCIAILFPLFSYPAYKGYLSKPNVFFDRLLTGIKIFDKDMLEKVLKSSAGSFLLLHTGLQLNEVVGSSTFAGSITGEIPKDSFESLATYLVSSNVWDEEFFRRHELTKADFISAAAWWDAIQLQKAGDGAAHYATPGIASELLFGYTPELNKYSVNLALPSDFSERLIGREEIVRRMERVLNEGENVLLTGQPGVGKKTVVLEFARRASIGDLGSKMAYRRILEFDYNFLLSETVDINAKKAKLALILKEAAAAGNIILMVRDIHRLTNFDVEGYDFTDIFEEHLEKKDLSVIAVLTSKDYERFMASNLRLKKYFEPVEVIPPKKEEAFVILTKSATKMENDKKIIIPIQVLRKVLDESDRYITDTPFPEKALELLDAVLMYRLQQGGDNLTVGDLNIVLSEKTGVSFARLTQQEKKRLGNLEEIIHQRLVNQDIAVRLIAKSLRAKTVGVIKENRPLGSFLFLGPTGVGKTETAKVLSKVYYGSEENILRFDMAEFAGKEGLERLIGSSERNQPGVLTTAIKNHPASLLLLDEIEKSSQEIVNLFLSLLDEGIITDAFAKKIIGRHLFIIGTSNAGAEYIRQLVNAGTQGEELQEKVLEYVLKERVFSPEFLNRFDGVVVYGPLQKEHLVKIAGFLLEELALNLKEKGIVLEMSKEATEKLAEDGYDPAFGARPMKRIINLVLGDLLGKAVLADEIKEGDKIRLTTGSAKEEFHWQKV
jgi:ATP-dependent Clp protease ATP-binding subunit ClpC